jgi:hypothetical protein
MSTPTPLLIHPAALVLPPLRGEDYQELFSSIQRQGLMVRVALWRNPADNTVLIVDGVHRAKVLAHLGIAIRDESGNFDPKLTEFWECPATALGSRIVAANLHRRHIHDARERITLAVAAMQAAAKFAGSALQPEIHKGKPHGVVSKVAKAAGLSKPTVYQHRDLLPPGSVRTSEEIAEAIAQVNLAHLPPVPARKNGHGGGRPPSLARRIARRVGVSAETVERHLERSAAQMSPAVVTRELQEWSEEDRLLAHVNHCLERIGGADLSERYLLRRAKEQVDRIIAEFNEAARIELANAENCQGLSA